MTSWGLQVAKRFKAAKREMYLGSAEMTEESKAIFDEKTWRSLLGVVAKHIASDWTVRHMPKRWDRQYAQTKLGKRQLGNDNIPFFESKVKNPERRWIAMAKDTRVSGGARGKAGGRVIKASVKHSVPNIVRKQSIKKFGTIPTSEARSLGGMVSLLIADMSTSSNIKAWRRGVNQKTKRNLRKLRFVLAMKARTVKASVITNIRN